MKISGKTPTQPHIILLYLVIHNLTNLTTSRSSIQQDTKIKVLITAIIVLLFPNSRLVFCQIFSYDVPKFQECGPSSYIPGLCANQRERSKTGKTTIWSACRSNLTQKFTEKFKKHTQRAQVKITQCKRGIGMIQDQC